MEQKDISTTNKPLLIVEDNGKIKCLSLHSLGDGTSQMETHDINKYTHILKNDSLDNKLFHSLKDICSFLPVRIKGSNYQSYCMGLYSTKERDNIVRPDNRTATIKRYTSEDNWFCTRINLYLAIDTALLENYSKYIKELKCCIGWQQPKYKGLCYRGAFMSPFEIWTYQFKGRFYIPSFTSTSIKKDVAVKTFKGNTLFEIDTTAFNRFTTLIQNNQTVYQTENENLLSCYNVYQFVSYTYNKDDPYVLVRLQLIDYDIANDIITHSIKDADHGNLPSTLVKAGEKTKNRNVSPKELYDSCQEISALMSKK
jgi:hypothetical protein